MTKREENRGIRGWKAFALVFGSGLGAAFIVFLAIVGVLNTLATSISSASGPDGQPQIGSATGSAHESLPPGKLNLCSTTIDDIGTVTLTRLDEGENYSDSLDESPAPKEEIRTVTDRCEWNLAPESSGALEQWNLKFSYTGFVPTDNGASALQQARKKYESESRQVGSGIPDSQDGGKVNPSDESRVGFGSDLNDDSATKFDLAGRIKSVVYHVEISDPNEKSSSPGIYRHEVEKILREINIDINLWVPDDEE